MVRDPLRELTELFAPTVYATGPLPMPLAPAVILSHVAFAVAVHAHDASEAFTVTLAEPAVAAGEALGGVRVNVHGGAIVRFTVTCNGAPPLSGVRVMAPVYGPTARPAGFTDTETDCGVGPTGCVTLSHPALEAADTNGIAEPVTLRDCAADAAPPCTV